MQMIISNTSPLSQQNNFRYLEMNSSVNKYEEQRTSPRPVGSKAPRGIMRVRIKRLERSFRIIE